MRTMSPFDIEDQIQKAQQDGQFDNLRGQGKPFTHLDTDAFEQLVREQGFRPHFVELDHEIRAKTEIARQAVRRTYEWVIQARDGGLSLSRHETLLLSMDFVKALREA